MQGLGMDMLLGQQGVQQWAFSSDVGQGCHLGWRTW